MKIGSIKEIIAVGAFVILEMFALRFVLGTILIKSGIAQLLPSDIVFVALAFLLAAAIGLLIGLLIFKTWQAKFSLKLITATGIIVASLVFSNWMSLVMLRSSFGG